MGVLLGIFSLVFVVDQATKAWLFSFDSLCNTASGLGFFDIDPLGVSFWLVLLVIGVSISYAAANVLVGRFWEAFAWTLLISGGISNGMDRLILGCVRDVLPFFGWFQWNIADGSIVFGAVCLVIFYGILKL
jgi:lipoprotein signal peptidase